ncbi:hypothetical protein SUGI_1097550, partial [Cryptomeria japonica]
MAKRSDEQQRNDTSATASAQPILRNPKEESISLQDFISKGYQISDKLGRMTQDAAAVSHTPPPVTTAATSTPEVLTGDEMSQIDDITLSAIDFGLQGYTGTPSASRARPKKKNISKTPKHVKK